MAGTTGCTCLATFKGNIMTVKYDPNYVLTGFLAKGTKVSATFGSGNTIEAIILDMKDTSSAQFSFTIDNYNTPISDVPADGINFVDDVFCL